MLVVGAETDPLLVVAVAVCLLNLAADIFYAAIDPRVRLS